MAKPENPPLDIPALRALQARQVVVCHACEGEGEYADGLDGDACSTHCEVCDGNGWLVSPALLDRAERCDELEGVLAAVEQGASNTIHLISAKLGELEAENARLRADAARYQWLRDHSCPPHNFYISVPDEFHGLRYNARQVDDYIDAARAALTGGDDGRHD